MASLFSGALKFLQQKRQDVEKSAQKVLQLGQRVTEAVAPRVERIERAAPEALRGVTRGVAPTFRPPPVPQVITKIPQVAQRVTEAVAPRVPEIPAFLRQAPITPIAERVRPFLERIPEAKRQVEEQTIAALPTALQEPTRRLKGISEAITRFGTGQETGILPETARFVTGLGLTVAEPVLRAKGIEPKITPTSPLGKIIFGPEGFVTGEEAVTPLQEQIRTAQERTARGLEKIGVGEGEVTPAVALAAGPLLGLASVTEVLPGGGKVKPVAKSLAKIDDLGKVTIKIKKELPGLQNVEEFAKEITKTTDARKIERRLKEASRQIQQAQIAPRVAQEVQEVVPKVPTPLAKTIKKEPRPTPVTTKNTELLKNNIRFDKLKLGAIPEAKESIERALIDGQNFADQRRGVQTFEATREAANKLVPSIKLKKGTILNAEESLALSDLVAGYSNKIAEVSKRIAAGDNKTETLLELQKLRADQTLALASLSGAKAEIGRALSAQRMISNVLDPAAIKDANRLQNALNASGGRRNVQKAALKLAQLGDDEVAKTKYLISLSQPGGFTKVARILDWSWYNSLLSGPKTQERNIIGTAAHIGFRVATKPVAAAIDSLAVGKAKLLGKDLERQVFLGELPSEIAGLWKGMPDGYRKAMFMLKNGFTLEDVALTELRAPEAFAGILPNIVSRSMEAADLFMKSMAGSSELQALAWKNAKLKKLQGKAFANEVANFLDNPPLEALERAKKVAEIDTFTNQAGKISQTIAKARQNIPVVIGSKEVEIFNPAKLIVPFVNTVANVTKRGIEATPAGLITSLAIEDPRLRRQAQGKAVLGSIISLVIANEAVQGRISGQGPKDFATRQALMATGWRPNSFRIGDKWFSYQLLSPLNIALGLVGNAHDAYVYDKEEPNVNIILAKLGNTILSASFLSGLNDFLKGLGNDDLSKITRRTATSAVPFSAFLRTVAQADDPFVRETETFKQQFKAGIPGLSATIPARLDILGKPIRREGGVLKRGLDPFNISTVQNTDEAKALRKAIELDVKLPTVGKTTTIRNPATGELERVSQRTRHVFQKVQGDAVRKALLNTMRDPGFKKLTSAEQTDLLNDQVDDTAKFWKETFGQTGGDITKIKNFQQLQEANLQARISERVVQKQEDKIVADFVTLLTTGKGDEQAIINELKGFTEDQQEGIEQEIKSQLAGTQDTDFERSLRKQRTDIRAAIILDQMRELDADQRATFLKDLEEKKILTKTTQEKLSLLIKQELAAQTR